MVSKKGTRAGYGDFQLGDEHWRAAGAAHRSVGRAKMGLGMGIHRYWRRRFPVGFVVVADVSRSRIAPASQKSGAGSHPQRATGDHDAHQVEPSANLSADVGLRAG